MAQKNNISDIILKDVRNPNIYVDLLESIICRSKGSIVYHTFEGIFSTVDVIKSMIALSDTEYDNFLRILQQVRLMQDSKVKDNTQSISQEDSHGSSK